MSQQDFMKAISEKSGCPQKNVKKVYDGMLEVLEEGFLNGEGVRFGNVFTVSVQDIPEQTHHSGLRPTYVVTPHKRLKFVVPKSFKTKLGYCIKESEN